MTHTMIKISSKELTYEHLKKSLAFYNLETSLTFEPHEHDNVLLSWSNHEKSYPLPVRVGQIIDDIEYFKHKAQRHKTKVLHFDNKSHLDTHLGFFHKDGAQEPINLTEKEVEILSYLHAHRDSSITREDLLDAVWNYAKDVETHTLETHIYRLRQKIEDDPANPEILKQRDNGYCV